MSTEQREGGDPSADLAARVSQLERGLEELAARLGRVEASRAGGFGALPRDPDFEHESAVLESADKVSEEALTWAGRASLLPRLATLCFLLVVALILRTVAETGLVSAFAGNFLGMGYAGALMLAGWNRYAKQSPLAPVFAATGAILMATVVVETQSHFQSLPLIPAYFTLMGSAILLALMSARFNAFMPVSVGLLATCFAAAAMGWPHPNYPYLSLVLLTANVLGYFASRLKRCSWLRWIVLAITIGMMGYWGLRVGISARGVAGPALSLAPDWYVPIVALFFLTFVSLSLLGSLRSGPGAVSRFDLSLPPLNAIWAATAIYLAIHPLERSAHLLYGLAGLLLALAHLVLLLVLARKRGRQDNSIVSYLTAGIILLAFAAPVALGSFVFALPVLALLGLFLLRLSAAWANEGIRGFAYFVQVYASLGGVTAILLGNGAKDPIMATLALCLVAVLGILGFAWLRANPPTVTTSLFMRIDASDRGAVLILLSAMLAAYMMVRMALALILSGLPEKEASDIFLCSQSAFINLVVIILITLAWLRSDSELRNVAILLTVVGVIKVFLFDFLQAQGLPLVLSVFSFGLAATVESVALSKWRRDAAGRKRGVGQAA